MSTGIALTGIKGSPPQDFERLRDKWKKFLRASPLGLQAIYTNFSIWSISLKEEMAEALRPPLPGLTMATTRCPKNCSIRLGNTSSTTPFKKVMFRIPFKDAFLRASSTACLLCSIPITLRTIGAARIDIVPVPDPKSRRVMSLVGSNSFKTVSYKTSAARVLTWKKDSGEIKNLFSSRDSSRCSDPNNSWKGSLSWEDRLVLRDWKNADWMFISFCSFKK